MTAKDDNSRRGRASREKGKRGEREIAKAFRDAGWDTARRTAQYCGKTGAAADVVGIPGLHIEVKFVERESIRAWYRQAVRDAQAAGKDDTPVVIHRRTHTPWLVTLSLDDFVKLMTGKGEKT